MYLTSKLSGVRVGRMHVPDELSEFTTNIIQFVLASPGLQDDKAEFTLEKGVKPMFENENQNVEEITNPQNENESEDAENCSNPLGSGIPQHIKETLNALAMRAVIGKVLELEEKVEDLVGKVAALQHSPCACQCSQDKETATI